MSLPLIDIGSLIAVVGLATSVVTLYFNQRKTKKDLELAKEYIHVLSKLVESYRKGIESQQQFEKDKFEWRKLETLGKALWGIVKHSEEE